MEHLIEINTESQSAMLKTTGRSVGSDLEDADVTKRQYLPEEARIPDFFDHWMEEYAGKIVDRSVAPDTGKQRKGQNLGHSGRKSLKRPRKKERKDE
jgi:hypothetical protein